MIGKNSRYASSILLRDASGDTLGTRRRIEISNLLSSVSKSGVNLLLLK